MKAITENSLDSKNNYSLDVQRLDSLPSGKIT